MAVWLEFPDGYTVSLDNVKDIMLEGTGFFITTVDGTKRFCNMGSVSAANTAKTQINTQLASAGPAYTVITGVLTWTAITPNTVVHATEPQSFTITGVGFTTVPPIAIYCDATTAYPMYTVVTDDGHIGVSFYGATYPTPTMIPPAATYTLYYTYDNVVFTSTGITLTVT